MSVECLLKPCGRLCVYPSLANVWINWRFSIECVLIKWYHINTIYQIIIYSQDTLSNLKQINRWLWSLYTEYIYIYIYIYCCYFGHFKHTGLNYIQKVFRTYIRVLYFMHVMRTCVSFEITWNIVMLRFVELCVSLSSSEAKIRKIHIKKKEMIWTRIESAYLRCWSRCCHRPSSSLNIQCFNIIFMFLVNIYLPRCCVLSWRFTYLRNITWRQST